MKKQKPWPTVRESKLWPIPPMDAFLYEIHQGDVLRATVSGPDHDLVLASTLANAGRYRGDGPVDVYRVLRVKVILPKEMDMDLS